jgi:hypothetical protein
MAVSFKEAHFPQEIILTCVRWYVVYPLSTRYVEELMGGTWGSRSAIGTSNARGTTSGTRSFGYAQSDGSRLTMRSHTSHDELMATTSLRNHPEHLHESVRLSALIAFKETFPYASYQTTSAGREER